MRPRHLLTACAIIGAFSAYAGPVTCRWTAETSKPAAHVIDAFQGETIHIEPTLVSYGAAVAVTNATLTLYWQTNGMGAAWWSKPAAADSSVTGRVRAVFAPTNDCAAAQYTFFIQATDSAASNFRAYGLIRMRSSPGYAPTAAPAPGYQWVSPSELQAVSNAIAAQVANETTNRASGDAKSTNYTDAVAAGKVSTTDPAYLAACTSSVYYAGLTTFVSNRVTYIGTNAFSGGGGATAQTNQLYVAQAGTAQVAIVATSVTGTQSNLIAGAVQTTDTRYLATLTNGSPHSSLSSIEGAGTLHVSVSETNKIATALQPGATSGIPERVTAVEGYTNRAATALQAETDPVWAAVSNAVRVGAAAGATALQPTSTNSLATTTWTSNLFDGVVITGAGGYTVTNYFESNVNWTAYCFTNATSTMSLLRPRYSEILVVGGGGRGKSSIPGGGGAGGLILTSQWLTAESAVVSVGAGATLGETTGHDSTFGAFIAKGGGESGIAGGSGGGSDIVGEHPAGTAGQGNQGGAGDNMGSGGGGGGAGAAGADGGEGGQLGGAGGDGRLIAISGIPQWYAGGGGGYGSLLSGAGGQGGGGQGGVPGVGGSGTPNTGGGGGQGGTFGGSGIVIVRLANYALPDLSIYLQTNATPDSIGAISNNGVTINGITLGNGTNLTITAAQTGAVATNDTRYLAALTNEADTLATVLARGNSANGGMITNITALWRGTNDSMGLKMTQSTFQFWRYPNYSEGSPQVEFGSSKAYFYTRVDCQDSLDVYGTTTFYSTVNGGNYISGITAAQVGAVPTNRTITIDGTKKALDGDLDFTTAAAGGVTFEQATNIVKGALSRFVTTNSIEVTNSTTFSIDLPFSSICIDDMRVFATTPGTYSRAYSIEFFRSSDFRRTYLAYAYTNGQFYATTTTVAQAVGATTNVVSDASGIRWPIAMYWQSAGGTTNDYVSFTNATATTLWNCCTNTIAMPVGSQISYVGQLGSFNYWDATGGSKLYGRIKPYTGWTGTVQFVIDGALK